MNELLPVFLYMIFLFQKFSHICSREDKKGSVFYETRTNRFTEYWKSLSQ